MSGEQAIFNLQIKKKSGLSLNPDIHHSKVFSSGICLNQELKVHTNTTCIITILTFIYISTLQIKLINVITSFASLYTCVVKLIPIQVLHSYRQS